MRAPTTWLRPAHLALFALVGIALHLTARYALGLPPRLQLWPLYAVLATGGVPLVIGVLRRLARRDFGADLLAGLSIVTSVLLGQYLAGAIVVLMLSGGQALEELAVGRASSVLDALAHRVPSVAHKKRDRHLEDVPLDAVAEGDLLVVLPHEICPVDGVVLEGHGVMDESYLTGEPYAMSKAPGSEVLSGAINGEQALTIRALRRAVDSRYAKIMAVMREGEQKRPRLRRLGDRLGAAYTPVALAVAVAAWAASGDPVRFLSVLVIATPCPLLIAIPVAILGAITLAARRSILIKNPTVLEQADTCRTIIFDKTGTLTYGKPALTDPLYAGTVAPDEVLRLAASLEQYSKHPLAGAIVEAARREGAELSHAAQVAEKPGRGLDGIVDGHPIRITGRGQLDDLDAAQKALLPPHAPGPECVVLIDGAYAATFRFRDRPRDESVSFVAHLKPRHGFRRVLLVSGDRESEVRYLAELVGITEVHAGKSPEEKVAIVTEETARARTMFVGDGINDAPALLAATVGLAFGHDSDITTEAAGAVVMDSSIERVDEFIHIGRRLRTIALQSALGGMALTLVGMGFAAAGELPPVAGAIAQEAIDLLAILNAVRMAFPPRSLRDF